MSKRKSIQWKGPNLNKEVKTSPIVAVGMDVFHSLICILLFMLSARIMLADVFEWGTFTKENILWIGVLSVLISAVMEASYYLNKKVGYFMRWGVLLVGIFAGIWYFNFAHHGDMIVSGSLAGLQNYLESWNDYYGTSLYVAQGGVKYVSEALDFWMVMICCFLLWEAKILRKNMVLAMAPAAVIVMELLVGYRPKELGLFLMFAGILWANSMGWKETGFRPMTGKRRIGKDRLISGGILGLLIVLLCTTVTKNGTQSAQKLVENPEMLEEFQKNLEAKLQGSWRSPFGWNEDSDVEVVSNRKPRYQNKPVLSLVMDGGLGEPSGTIYLKGFYADTYEDGKWTQNTEAFEEACAEAGYDSEQITEELASLGMTKLETMPESWLEEVGIPEEWIQAGVEIGEIQQSNTVNIYTTDMTLTYLKNSGEKAFFPYFIKQDNEEIRVEGETRYTKTQSLMEYSFSAWGHEGTYIDYIGDFMIEGRLVWEDWYEDYVLEHYLEVPDDMENVKRIANLIDGMRDIESDSYEMSQDEKTNSERLAAAEHVQNWLAQATDYSVELPELPDGMDPVEYFLEETRQGYCMHYASAGVMLLREMGVPARYASGYVAEESAFEEVYGGYEAKILDNKAHAWVEIYLNGIGWVPVEMTKGYEGSQITNIEDQDTTVDQSEKESESQAEESQEFQTKEEETESEPKETEVSDDTKGEEGSSSIGAVFGTILLIAAIIAVILGSILAFRKHKNDRIRLLKEIKRKRTRRAIKNINRKIYKKLRLAGKTFGNQLRDEEYEALLKKTYPKISEEDWSCYMKIVKEAAFSSGDISVEEMEFCYGIYQKLTQNS